MGKVSSLNLKGLLGIDSEYVLARKALVDTMNNSEVFTKLCVVIHVESLHYPLTYCFRFQSRPNMELSTTYHT